MASNNNNQINIPEARKSMYDMKHEVANELASPSTRTTTAT